MKKNIAIIVPELAGGGAERVASNLSIHLDKKKYNKYVVVYDNKKIDYSYKGKLINLKAKAINNPFGKIYNIVKRVIKMKKFKKNYNIDTTISLLSGPNIVNILSRQNDKVIVSIRNYISKSSSRFYGSIHKILIKLFYNKADSVVSVSKAIKEDLKEHYNIKNNKIKVINNPYDIEKIRELSKENIEEKYKEIFNKPTILNMGRLAPQKVQWHLIRAFKNVINKVKNIQLVILGIGELENYLKNLVKNLDLNENVHFLGFKNNPYKYIANSNIFVFPSLYEGFPNALAEAMACKVPVISSDCKSGPREILAPNTDINTNINNFEYTNYGILTPVCDSNFYSADDELTGEESKLAKVMIQVIKNKALRKKYSKLSYERVNDFNKTNIIKEWENEI